MKQIKPQDKPQQSAFITFLVLLCAIAVVSACGSWLQDFSALQIGLGLALILIITSLILWLIFRHWLSTQQSRYQSLYKQQLRDKLNLTVKPNGTLTDSTGEPIPGSPYSDLRKQSLSDNHPSTDNHSTQTHD